MLIRSSIKPCFLAFTAFIPNGKHIYKGFTMKRTLLLVLVLAVASCSSSPTDAAISEISTVISTTAADIDLQTDKLKHAATAKSAETAVKMFVAAAHTLKSRLHDLGKKFGKTVDTAQVRDAMKQEMEKYLSACKRFALSIKELPASTITNKSFKKTAEMFLKPAGKLP